jgi:hypothetical protein
MAELTMYVSNVIIIPKNIYKVKCRTTVTPEAKTKVGSRGMGKQVSSADRSLTL